MSGVNGLGAILPRRWVEAWEIHAHKRRMAAAFEAGQSIPESARLGTPIIKYQGGTQECFGFADVQAMNMRGQALGLPPRLRSPVIPYYMARRVEVQSDAEVEDVGSDPDGMIRALRAFGACDWDELPFDEAAVNRHPGHLAMVSAQKCLCTLEPIFEVGTDDMWTAIRFTIGVEKKPIIIAVDVVPAFEHPIDGVVDDPSGPTRGLHAVCLYGYDPDGALLANSWPWGGSRDGKIPHGCGKLTPRFIKEAVLWAAALDFSPPEAA